MMCDKDGASEADETTLGKPIGEIDGMTTTTTTTAT
jgi:hypothetical protein